VIARREMAARLRTLRCTHARTMRPVEQPAQVYPQTEGEWFCDECGLANPPGRMFHCGACDDYDLCAACMRQPANRALSSNNGDQGVLGAAKWASVQADEGLMSRVLGSRTANTRLAHGCTLDLLSGKRESTKQSAYANPFTGAVLVHGRMRYAGEAAGGTGPRRRCIPGFLPGEREAQVRKLAMLRRAMQRRQTPHGTSAPPQPRVLPPPQSGDGGNG
jgi:hypothetical protein